MNVGPSVKLHMRLLDILARHELHKHAEMEVIAKVINEVQRPAWRGGAALRWRLIDEGRIKFPECPMSLWESSV